MERYLSNLKRYWWLLLIVVALTTLIQTFTVKPDFNYQVKAVLLPETYVSFDNNNSGDTGELQVVTSEAKTHLVVIQSLLHSQFFLDKVTDNLEASGYQLTPHYKKQIQDYIPKEVKVTATDNNLIYFEYNDTDARYTLALMQSVVRTYNDYLLEIMQQRGQAMIDHLSKEVDQLKAEADKYAKQMREIFAESVDTGGPNLDEQIAKVNEANLAYRALKQNQQDTSNRYQTRKSQLEKLQITYDSFLKGDAAFIKVFDPPAITDSFTYTNTGRLIMGAAVGFFGGLVLALVMVMLLTWADPSIRETSYATSYLRTSLVEDFPQLKTPGNSQRKSRLMGARQTYSALLARNSE
ncbi:MAG TPA: hypothetical protein VH186_00590 [Chloroflexia bacterium]|nr:hypothetical protein [Chloroflexia bacterium]